MMSRPWIKLYTEMLDDPKMGDLSDGAYRRWVEMMLYAGQVDEDGKIANTRYIARKCHITVEQLESELQEMIDLKLVHEIDGNWFIAKWTKRQPKNTSNDRVKAYRERQQNAKKNKQTEPTAVAVTLQQRDSNVLDKELDIDKEGEEEARIHAPENDTSVMPAASPADANSYAKTFKAITGYWVGTSMQDYLQSKLGENPNWDVVGWAYEQWTIRGYNPRNLRGVLDWYQNRLNNPTWTPDSKKSSAQGGVDHGAIFDTHFDLMASRSKTMRGKVPDDYIAVVNALGRSRFQNCYEKDKKWLRSEFIKQAQQQFQGVLA